MAVATRITRVAPQPQWWHRLARNMDVYDVEVKTMGRPPSKPFVLLLGWGGATHKNLAKYAQLYNDRGYDTACFIPQLFKRRQLPAPSAAAAATNFINSECWAHRPFILQVMSLNGTRGLFSLYRGFEQIHGVEARRRWLDRLQGIVFDSAPGHAPPMELAKGVTATAPPLRLLAPLGHRVRIQALHTSYHIYDALEQIPGMKERLSMLEAFNHEVPMPQHQCFIYSLADKTILADSTEKFIELQRQAEQDVQVVKFVDSEHVAHVRKYRNEYEAALDRFLATVDADHDAGLQLQSLDEVVF